MKSTERFPVSTLPEEVSTGIASILARWSGNTAVVHDFTLVAGGCINHGGIVKTSAGNFFIKWNDVRTNPEMFELEARGLELLKKSTDLRIPNAVGTGSSSAYQFIVLEYIAGSSNASGFWNNLGSGIARLHRCSSEKFGLEYDNYIGALRQSNTLSDSWLDFFREERISKQLMLAEKNGLSDHRLRKRFDGLFEKHGAMLSEGKPALLHGDLWSGNIIADENGCACLIDPAVYYGNPEMEIAYTKLFGGFDDDFYKAYQAENPLDPGFNERADIYNLYPLLVHANLFGKKYFLMIDEILDRFR